MFGVLFNYYCIIRFNDRVETRDLFSCAVNIIKISCGYMTGPISNQFTQTMYLEPGTRYQKKEGWDNNDP